MVNNYSWYYLNTYVTNKDKEDHLEYIVDGQQRLTTLTLILIKLRHYAKKLNDIPLQNTITEKIIHGAEDECKFWLVHERYEECMKQLFEKEDNDIKTNELTVKDMLNNYSVISSYINKKFDEDKDNNKFKRFVKFFIEKLILVNLSIVQTDAPMIFEVINDRGVRLRPYEILKGKLLGQLPKKELKKSQLDEIWDKQIEKIQKLNGDKDEPDKFFTHYLKAKLSDSKSKAEKYDKDYHRSVFESDILDLKNQKKVKKFILKDFRYFTDLYCKIYGYSTVLDTEFKHVYFNSLNDRELQFMLILSSCKFEDKNEEKKIKATAYELDKLNCLLQLQRSYNSNDLTDTIYEINGTIRDKDTNEIKTIFDKALLSSISQNKVTEVKQPFNYVYFKDIKLNNPLTKTFVRYFLARIEYFLYEKMHKETEESFFDNLMKSRGEKYDIEHILSENEENQKQFNNNKEEFETERNRLGGLLLLKSDDNKRSGKEIYRKKLKTYMDTLEWNKTLVEQTYSDKKYKEFIRTMKNKDIILKPMDKFGPKELEERQKLLFEIARKIWR